MSENEQVLAGYAKQFAEMQVDLNALADAVKVRQQAEVSARAAQEQLEQLEKKIAKAQDALEKLEKEHTQRTEQYRSDRSKLLKQLEDRVVARKTQLAELDVVVAQKQTEYDKIDEGLRELRARLR